MDSRAKFTVQFYGHVCNNTEQFFRQLARVLEIDRASAYTLLRDVPVVIRRGLSRQDAERLMGELASIRALCLMKAEGDGAESVEQAQTRLAALREPISRQAETERSLRLGGLRSRLSLGVLTIILIVGSASFLFWHTKMHSANRATSRHPEATEATYPEQADPTGIAAPAAQLEERIDELDEKVEEIRSSMKIKEKDIASAYSGADMDYEQVQRSREELAALRDELLAKLQEVSNLRTEQQRLAAVGQSRL